jgi:hypothetical protein
MGVELTLKAADSNCGAEALLPPSRPSSVSLPWELYAGCPERGKLRPVWRLFGEAARLRRGLLRRLRDQNHHQGASASSPMSRSHSDMCLALTRHGAFSVSKVDLDVDFHRQRHSLQCGRLEPVLGVPCISGAAHVPSPFSPTAKSESLPLHRLGQPLRGSACRSRPSAAKTKVRSRGVMWMLLNTPRHRRSELNILLTFGAGLLPVLGLDNRPSGYVIRHAS